MLATIKAMVGYRKNKQTVTLGIFGFAALLGLFFSEDALPWKSIKAVKNKYLQYIFQNFLLFNG